MVDRAVVLLHHVHLHQRDRAVHHRLQVRRHGVAVQREAEDDQVRAAVQVQDPVLVVLDHAVAVPALPAAEAAHAGGNLFLDHVDDIDLVLPVPV